MKYRNTKTPYGLIQSRDYGYRDILPGKAAATLTRDQVFEHINPYHVKNSVRKARWRTSKYLYQLMWEIIVDHIMEGDMVELPYGGHIYIGIVGQKHKKFANLHSFGKVYGLKMSLPRKHEYKFKMSTRRRKQLAQNVKDGKNYHNY